MYYRNRWRCNYWHRCTQKQCAKTRDQTDFQITTGEGKRWLLDIGCFSVSSYKLKKNVWTAWLQDLMKDLKSELSKNLERLIISLMLTPAEFDAKMMRKAIEVMATSIRFCLNPGQILLNECNHCNVYKNILKVVLWTMDPNVNETEKNGIWDRTEFVKRKSLPPLVGEQRRTFVACQVQKHHCRSSRVPFCNAACSGSVMTNLMFD